MEGTWKQEWLWLGPDWKDINNPDTSHVGFLAGTPISPSVQDPLNLFIRDLGTGEAQLFKGPLFYQDGAAFVKAGEVASDEQIWYMEQLLKGMTGQSKAR